MAEKRTDEKAEEPEDTKAPPAKSELDPELVRLPRARTRVRPIMALAIMAICLTIGWRLSGDLIFSRQSATPMTVASIADLEGMPDNRFVEIQVIPDRPQALRILPTGTSVGQVLVPALGSQGKLWLLLPATPWTGPHGTDERYRGRLTRVRDLSFYNTLKSYIRAAHNVPRPIPLSEVTAALANSSTSVRDIAGEEVHIEASTYVRVHEVANQRARVYAVSTDPYDNEAAWRLALEGAGILPPETAAVSSDPGSWTFEVPAPQGVAGIREKLVQAKLFAASADEIASTREGTWAELSLDGDELVLGKPQLGFQIQRIFVGASLVLASDAFVLNTTEEPGTYWYALALVLILAFFALLFAFGLYRSRR